jgi:hypothetical protein
MEKSTLINIEVILVIALIIFFFTTKALPIMANIKTLIVNNLLLTLVIILVLVYIWKNKK